MTANDIGLSDDQWQLLAVLNTLGGSSSIELIGEFVPLKPGPLFDLLKKGKKNQLFQHKADDYLLLEKALPAFVQDKIKQLTDLKFLCQLNEQIQTKQLKNQIEPTAFIKILGRLGKGKEAAEIEFELVHQEQKQKNYQKVKYHLLNILDLLFEFNPENGVGSLFTTAVLHYSNICFLLGQELDKIEKYLQRALKVAGEIGDKRSQGLISLHFGRLYYFRNRRDDALVSLSRGYEEIKKLGDDDIVSQSSGFLGIYFFAQGLYHEALKFFEKAESLYKNDDEYNITRKSIY
ncbi:tetratricopeptide repeat protein [bacterium]|nr:tetratricopeptide repeat protein [bacterium]